MEDRFKINALEALLFAAGDPLEMESIAAILQTNVSEAHRLTEQLAQEYDYAMRGMQIMQVGKKVQMTTRAQYFDHVQELFQEYISSKMSQAALETLAIIAYRQPVTRPEIEAIRGVNSSSSVRNLLDRGLIAEAGRKEVIGRPVLFETTERFLMLSGVESIENLPEYEALSQQTDPALFAAAQEQSENEPTGEDVEE